MISHEIADRNKTTVSNDTDLSLLSREGFLQRVPVYEPPIEMDSCAECGSRSFDGGLLVSMINSIPSLLAGVETALKDC